MPIGRLRVVPRRKEGKRKLPRTRDETYYFAIRLVGDELALWAVHVEGVLPRLPVHVLDHIWIRIELWVRVAVVHNVVEDGEVPVTEPMALMLDWVWVRAASPVSNTVSGMAMPGYAQELQAEDLTVAFSN